MGDKIMEYNKAVMARLLNLDEVQERLGIGRSKALDLMYTGELRSVKIGSRRLVSEAALNEFIAGLEAGK